MKTISKDIFSIRKKIIQLSYSSKSAHLGSSLSCVEILYSLILFLKNKKYKNSEIIMSKGHASMAYLSCLEYFRFIKKINVNKYLKKNSEYWGHISRNKKNNYLKFSFGSLGCGLGIAAGIAYHNLHNKIYEPIFVVMSDGELNEGSVFESAQFIAHHNLYNIKILIDNNKIQSFGRTKEILNINYKKVFASLNYITEEVNGHFVKDILKKINKKRKYPLFLICNTIKGRGLKNTEDKLESHYYPASTDDLL
jgi:transketolase